MRYFLGFLVTILLIIVVLVLIFGGGGGGTARAPIATKELASYAGTDAKVRMTIVGQVNAKSLHNEVRITVGKTRVVYQHIRGYNDGVVDQQTFSNTQSSYSEFLSALGHSGFTRGNNSKALANDSGYCPLGQRYIFELNNGPTKLQRYWTSSCGSPKTFLGATPTIITLFQNQVPDYDQLTQDIDF